MTPPLALLIFIICAPASGHEYEAHDACEHGEILHTSCDAAAAWLRAGLREGQTLHVTGCEAR